MTLTLVTLTGQRAKLIPMVEEHAEGLRLSIQDPDVWRYLPWQQMPTLGDALAYVRQALDAQEAGMALPYTIFDSETGAIVGSTQPFDVSLPHRQGEIGWTWLDPSVWRTCVNTECKYLLRHCFEALGFVRVQLKADARNEHSHRAMERIGAVREGTLRKHRILPDGFVRDTVYYSAIAEEWPQAKAHLERLLERHS